MKLDRFARSHYYSPADASGAMMQPSGGLASAYEINPEVAAMAIRLVRRKAEDSDLLIDILGLSGYAEEETS